MQSLLLFLKPEMERQTGLSLFPTFSYFRIYKKGDTLGKHTDRDACEVSATLCLKGDEWPIFIRGGTDFLSLILNKVDDLSSTSDMLELSSELEDNDESKVFSAALSAGDALIYRGCDHEHWREKFEGKSLAQVFLHYVDANGKNSEWANDKHPDILTHS
tara:strand:- start:979 stop:1458 length:480 start_codon:yes stop_codon:yes gene_type:complete